MLRLTGRVSADETRVYRISSVTEGWIRELSPATTGSFVRKNQVLGAYYSQEIQGPQQAYLYALEALDRFVGSGSATDEQIEINQKNVRNARQALLNLGMGAAQLDEIARTRKVSQNIQILAPADGVLLERNLTVGQPFDRTRDLFVIADLSRVWVLADAFEGDAADIVTGGPAEAVHPVLGRRFPARVSDVPRSSTRRPAPSGSGSPSTTRAPCCARACSWTWSSRSGRKGPRGPRGRRARLGLEEDRVRGSRGRIFRAPCGGDRPAVRRGRGGSRRADGR